MRDPQMRRTKSSPGQTGVPPELVMVQLTGEEGETDDSLLAKKMIWNGSTFTDDGAEIEVFDTPLVRWVAYSKAAQRWLLVMPGVLIIEFTITDDSPLTGSVDLRPDGMETVPGEEDGEVPLVNPFSLTANVGMQGSATYMNGGWRINLALTCP